MARALGRPFVRIAVGGVRDEAEIRGHRRTYVGARAGPHRRRALTEAKAMNPVVLIDEVDKLQAGGWSGDPSSALLEVLDPAQNHTFRDHYLELDLDLSDVLFLTTANVLDTIPGPLLDRMELVQLDGYTEDEKVAIAKHHLFPRQREKAGLREDELEITDSALHALVAGWTREAGVRNLERQLGKVMRKAARKVAAGETATVVVDDDTINDYVGRPRFHAEDATRAPVPGLATGLAVTGAGGDVLTIEVTAMDGEPGLQVTGQLGDVMSESAQIALSFVRANAEELDVPERRVRSPALPPARAVGRGAEGRSFGRHHDDHGARVVGDRPAGEARRRHDRRGHVAGSGAADRRAEAEGARGAPRRAHRRGAPDRQRARPRRRARSGSCRDALPPRAQRARGVGAGADLTPAGPKCHPHTPAATHRVRPRAPVGQRISVRGRGTGCSRARSRSSPAVVAASGAASPSASRARARPW